MCVSMPQPYWTSFYDSVNVFDQMSQKITFDLFNYIVVRF